MGLCCAGCTTGAPGAMVLAVCAHLATVFFAGSFKAPRELTWLLGVGLLLATLGLGFTGYLLPWDQKAYWATVVSANIPRDVPVVGEVFTRLLLAGDSVSGLTLTRFYAIHMLVLPSIAALLIVGHIYLVRLHGVAEPERASTAAAGAGPRRPLLPGPRRLRSLIVFAGVLAILVVLSVAAPHPPGGDRRQRGRELSAAPRVVLHVAVPDPDLFLGRLRKSSAAWCCRRRPCSLLAGLPFPGALEIPGDGRPTARDGRRGHGRCRNRLPHPDRLRRRPALRHHPRAAGPPVDPDRASPGRRPS